MTTTITLRDEQEAKLVCDGGPWNVHAGEDLVVEYSAYDFDLGITSFLFRTPKGLAAISLTGRDYTRRI